MLVSFLLSKNVEKRRSAWVMRLTRAGDCMEFTSYVRKEGRVTLPKEVRDALGIEEGCLVRCEIERVRSRK